jgi:hypothetical protein
VATATGRDAKIAAAQRRKPGTGRHHILSDVQADLAPLIDQPNTEVFVRLIDVAVHQFEAEAFFACLLQQPARLGSRLLDVGPEAGDSVELVFVGCQW